ncbi:hypothetical protein [Stella sp.]|uniref:hypothetical protein n=1 Tax=Stella sp. TaxID=2912054 RepID=UPI0035B0DCAD
MRSFAAALAAVLLLAALPASGQTPGGAAPTYSDRPPGEIPNAEAIDRRFWAPGLDEGYVPQGITLAPDGAVLVSGYRSTDPKVGGGPARIWAVDPATGAVRGTFDLPEGFAHAGGIAMGAGGRLWVADTRLLGRFDLARALAAGGTATAERTWVLAEPLRGSFLSRHGGRLWIGGWNPNGEGRMFALDEATVETAGTLDERHVQRSFAIPSRAQGAGFDRAGALWITRSSSRIGELLKLDPADGRVLATYQTAIGIEDLGFDAEGRLWSVSEAGSRRWLGWAAFYPLLFRLDPDRLR